MLARNFMPEFTWVSGQNKSPLNKLDKEPLCIKSVRCTPKAKLGKTPTKMLRNYTSLRQPHSASSSKCARKQAELNRAIIMNTLISHTKNKSENTAVRSNRPKSAKISTLSIALMKYRSINTPKKPVLNTTEYTKNNGFITINGKGINLPSKSLKGTSTSSKKINFKELSLKRKNLIKISTYHKQCEAATEYPILLVSQMSSQTTRDTSMNLINRKRAATTGGKKADSFSTSATKWQWGTIEPGDYENEYGLFLRKNTFRPITSGAIVVKTREGKFVSSIVPT